MSQLLLEFKPRGTNIFICSQKQKYGAENKIYFLASSHPTCYKFCSSSFVEVASDLEKMARVINKYVKDFGYQFNTQNLKGTRPLLYNKMKRFFLPELISWDTPVLVTTKRSREVVKHQLTISREQKSKEITEKLAAFFNE